jgi:TfoX/Sxy family transcriptional regulator of competence genes
VPPVPEILFQQLVGRFSADPSVEPPAPGGKFGASGLKVDGKLFAMLSKGELVVKLPRQRVEQLVAEGTARPFDPGHGRLMKQWATIAPEESGSWAELAEEARQFVADTARRSAPRG